VELGGKLLQLGLRQVTTLRLNVLHHGNEHARITAVAFDNVGNITSLGLGHVNSDPRVSLTGSDALFKSI
jgi:hypothetical protein